MRNREKSAKDILNVLDNKPGRKKWITTLFVLLALIIFGSILSLTMDSNLLFNSTNKIQKRAPIAVKDIISEINNNVHLLKDVKHNKFELNNGNKDAKWKECIMNNDFLLMVNFLFI